MTKVPGKRTQEIGKQLKQKLIDETNKFEGINLFYDHGDSSDPEVCAPTTYMGRRYGDDATLSNVDIILTKGNEVILAVEIEESSVSPKKVIGDIFGIAIADSIMIQEKPYSLKDVTVIVAYLDEEKGKQSNKYQRLEEHLKKYFATNTLRSVSKVRIIPCKKGDMVRRIERLIRFELGKNT